MDDKHTHSDHQGSEVQNLFILETERTDPHVVNANGTDLCPIPRRHLQHQWTITYPDYGEVTYYCWGVGYQPMRDKRGR